MRANARRGANAALAFIVGLSLFAAVSCSADGGAGGPGGTPTTANIAALGTPNKATGSPIKIGLVNDGKTEGIDHTPLIAAFNATVKYANEYLGGLNGHVLEVDACETKNTPAGATTCAVQLANDKVAAVLVPVSAQDAAVFTGLEGTGIPYIAYTAASQDILLKPGSFLLTNPVAAIAAPAKLAADKGYDKVGFVIIDVPAATGPIGTIAKPIYANAGIGLDLVPISPQVADMTPQIQQAISSGAKLFTVTGTQEFNASAIKALKQLGFQGDIVIGPPTQTLIDGVPGGLEGLIVDTTINDDPATKDRQLFDAVLATGSGTAGPVDSGSEYAFVTVLAFVRALTGVTTAVDAASIASAMSAMPKPVDLPMGGGITFQCGSKPVKFVPNVCSANVLAGTLDAQNRTQNLAMLDVSKYQSLG
jgi:branched-chain amino acid transport system substrate-binding protein